MWQKIKCWLGWHEYIPLGKCTAPFDYDCGDNTCSYCVYREWICKHCGKVKK